MPYAAALSQHPIAAHAVGEAVGQVIESVGEEPDLAVLFVTTPHTGAMEDIVGAVRSLLRPRTLVGSTAGSVLGGAREVEEEPALVLWAGRLGGRGTETPVIPVRIDVVPSADGWELTSLPGPAAQLPTLLLLTDPFSFPADQFVDHLAETHPNLTVAGGMASSARAPGGNRLVLDGELFSDGAVGVLLDGATPVRNVVSQGCRPIGEPMVVTKGEGQVIYELAGKPALERLQELVAALSPEERALAANGLHLGRVINEQKVEFGRGDFLIRNVLGADREVGAIAVGDQVELGATIQFQVRDAESADEDLRTLMSEATGRANGALVFTCNGRGTHLFGMPDHDASLVSEHVGHGGLAGMFCAGELGPVGGRSFVHGFTASVVLFEDPG
jgi:small ligand-binding sensory domain FIST